LTRCKIPSFTSISFWHAVKYPQNHIHHIDDVPQELTMFLNCPANNGTIVSISFPTKNGKKLVSSKQWNYCVHQFYGYKYGIFQMFQPKMEIGSSTLPPVFHGVSCPCTSTFRSSTACFLCSRFPGLQIPELLGALLSGNVEVILDLYRGISQMCYTYIYTLWLFNIAMENGPFIDGLPGFTY